MVKGESTLSEVSSKFEVHSVQVSQWKKELVTRASELFDHKKPNTAKKADSEREELYREIGRMKMEIDWLKKKLGILE